MKPRQFHTPNSNIIISFREEQGRTMHAAFYDHYVIRKITNQNTLITISPDISKDEINQKIKKLSDFINDSSTIHTLGLNDEQNTRVIPSVASDIITQGGLLIIPGQRRFPKPGEHFNERMIYENQMIKNALLNGQPILAICGGIWKLWNILGGEIVSVDGHVSPSMPTILDDGNIGNNPQVHNIIITDNTILKTCMEVDQVTVNSVHWAAPLANEKILKIVQVSAVSQEKNLIDSTEHPTENTIEAFENKFGAPMLGIQWHPEAYYKNKYENKKEENDSKRHLKIIEYMAKSGDAYQAKQKALQEFKNKLSPSEICIKISLFRDRSETLQNNSPALPEKKSKNSL